MAVLKRGFNLAEIGAYMMLLAECWDNASCSLPDDNRMLQKMIGWKASCGDWRKVRARFSAHPIEQGRLCNERLLEEFRYCESKSQKAAESGKLGGLARAASSPLPPRLADRSGSGFESVGQIADKHFKPR